MRACRILITAIETQGPGGIQRYLRDLHRALATFPGVEQTMLAVHDRRGDRSDAMGFHGNKRAMLASFARRLRRARPDVVVYSHVLLAPLVHLGRAMAPGARHVVIAYGIDAWEHPGWWQRVAVQRMNEVWSISEVTARRMLAAYAALPPVTIVPPGLTFRGDRAATEFRGNPRILSVARMAAHDQGKGIDQVIRSLPEVIQRFPGCHYHVAGDGVLRPALERLAAAVGVGEHVTFHGWLDDRRLGELYAGSDVFVLPSSKEGFGIVYLEAWSHALPVIAGAADAGAEVVAHGRTGLVVDPQLPGALEEALTCLLDDPALRRRLGRAGAAHARSMYSFERFRERVAGALGVSELQESRP